MTNKEVQDKLRTHVQLVKEKFPDYTFYFCALYGSQNYGLDTEDSDVDSKIAIIPNSRDIILGRDKLSTTLHMPDGSVCEVKDLREMMVQFYKGNINFTEMLYTPYYIKNDDFSNRYSFDSLRSNRDMIVNHNPLALIKMAAAMARTKYLTFTKVNNNNKEVIEKYGYDPKSLVTLLRLESFIYSYLVEYPEDYRTSLTPKNNEELRYMRTNPLSSNAADILAKKGIESVDEMLRVAIKKYSTEELQNKSINNSKKVSKYLDDFTYGLIWESMVCFG